MMRDFFHRFPIHGRPARRPLEAPRPVVSRWPWRTRGPSFDMRDLSSAAPPRVAASAILPPAAGNRSDLARGTAESLPASPLVRILGVMVFNFLSYLAVGLPLAVLPLSLIHI